MDKQIKIKAVLDNTEFNGQIQKLEQRMKNMQGTGPTAGVTESAGSPAAMKRYTQQFYSDYNKDNVSKLRETFNLNARNMQNESRDLRNKQRELQGLEKIEGSMTNAQKARVGELSKEIELIKERGRLLLQENSMLSQQAAAMGSPIHPPSAGGPPTGGPPTGGTPPTGGDGDAQARFAPAAIRGAIGGAIGGAIRQAVRAAISVADELAQKQRHIALAEGRATEMAITPLREQMEGRGVEGKIFMEERLRGFQVSGEEMETARGRDILRGAGGRIASRAAIGAGIGSFVPGVGTAIGAGLGAVFGGIESLTDKRTRGAILDTEEYQSMLTVEGLEKQKQVEAADKLRNFQRTMAYEEFQNNAQMYRQHQREFGLGRATDPEGMVGLMLQSGMTRETGLELGTQLMRSSGVTTRPTDVGDLRQMQLLREGGITNIGQVAGRIRGMEVGFGDRSQSDMLAKILQEAIKGGINESDMVEETRQFLDVTTRIAAEKNTAADIIAQELSRGMMAPTARGMAAAQGAMQMREAESADISGPRGAFKWAFAGTERGREMLGGLSGNFEQLSTFLGMPLSQIDEQNPMVQRMMQEMGVDNIDEFRRRKREFDLRAATPRGETFTQLKSLGEATAGMDAEEFKRAIGKGGELSQQYTDIVSALGVERGESFRALPFTQQMAYVRGLTDVAQETDETGQLIPRRTVESTDILGEIEARGAAAPTTRFEAAKAADQLASMNRLNDYVDEFATIADQHATVTKTLLSSTTDVDEAMKLFQTAIKNGAESLGELQNIMIAIREFSQTGNQERWDEAMDRLRQSTEAPSVTGNTTGSARMMGGKF